jgi:hypothetical protein
MWDSISWWIVLHTSSGLRDVMVIVLATGPKVREYKPGRGRYKSEAFLRRGSETVGLSQDFTEYKNYFEAWPKILRLPSPSSSWFATRWLLVGFSESSGGRIRNFPSRYHSTMVLHAHISRAGWTIGPLVAAVQRHILTPSAWSSSFHTNCKPRQFRLPILIALRH